jgi:hypothetical protein
MAFYTANECIQVGVTAGVFGQDTLLLLQSQLEVEAQL